MALHTVCRADHEHRAVQHLKHTLHLCGKIHMPRRVKQRNLHILPPEHCLLRKNRNPPLPLKLICIEECIAMVHTPHTADPAAQIKHSL